MANETEKPQFFRPSLTFSMHASIWDAWDSLPSKRSLHHENGFQGGECQDRQLEIVDALANEGRGARFMTKGSWPVPSKRFGICQRCSRINPIYPVFWPKP
jgi:hypothetical protein